MPRLASRFILPFLALAAILLVSGNATPTVTRAAGPLVVNTVADTFDGFCDADCSLRDAIFESNATADRETIEFDISGSGVKEIVLRSNLPEITAAVLIDGRTQTGANCSTHSLTVSIVGGGTATQGFRINHIGLGSAINGLNIRNINGPAIVFAAGSIHGVRCSNIGTNADGTAASPNTGDGIVIEAGTSGSSGILIGANALAGDPIDEERNIISGNLGAGIRSSGGTPVRVSGNYIGTNAAGTAAIGNGDSGVVGAGGTSLEIGISSAGGGSGIGVGNLISGNTGSGDAGIKITGTTGAIIRGNTIGLNVAGTAALPNQAGIVTSATSTFIGDSGAANRNVISGNVNEGILFLAGGASGSARNNYIGTNAAGTAAIGNGSGIGIFANNASVGIGSGNVISGNVGNAISIGGGGSGANIPANLIGYAADGTTPLPNGGNGIELTSTLSLATTDVSIGGGGAAFDNKFYIRRASGGDPLRNAVLATWVPGNEDLTRIAVSGNFIDSDGHGIDLRLSTDGFNQVTPNDDDDVDTDGPNAFSNFPVVTVADASGPTISGTFNGMPDRFHTLHFYVSDSCDSATRRIGQVPLGTTLLSTDANGDSLFLKSSFTAVFEAGDFITVTAVPWSDPDDEDASFGTSEFSDCFEASGAPGLQITQLVPASMPAGSFEFELKVQGSGITFGDQIRWNGTPLATNYTGTTELRATISTATLGATKSVVTIDIVSTSPVATSNEVQFTVSRSSSDVNCNGTATTDDALLVLKVLAGLETNTSGCQTDAMQNGSVSIEDARWIRAEVAGLVQPLASFTP